MVEINVVLVKEERQLEVISAAIHPPIFLWQWHVASMFWCFGSLPLSLMK
jgi:hypothetical protein